MNAVIAYMQLRLRAQEQELQALCQRLDVQGQTNDKPLTGTQKERQLDMTVPQLLIRLKNLYERFSQMQPKEFPSCYDSSTAKWLCSTTTYIYSR